MNTLNFLDANVWLALIWSRHVHSEKARTWFEACPGDQFFYCRITQLTVLRLLTTDKIMGADVQTMAGAWRFWTQIAADDRISFLAEPDDLEREFRSLSQLASASPKVWADSYLMAFSSLAGTRLVSFDRAMAGRSGDVLVLS